MRIAATRRIPDASDLSHRDFSYWLPTMFAELRRRRYWMTVETPSLGIMFSDAESRVEHCERD
jgi:hypothetical protein